METVTDDVTEYDSIERAFEGKDAAVNLAALPHSTNPAPERFTTPSYRRRGQRRTRGERTRPRQVRGDEFARGGDGQPDHVRRTQGLGDLVAEDADLDWVVLRPSFIFGEGSETIEFIRRYTTPYVTVLPEGGDEPTFQPLRIGDTARITADAIEDDEYVGETYDLGARTRCRSARSHDCCTDRREVGSNLLGPDGTRETGPPNGRPSLGDPPRRGSSASTRDVQRHGAQRYRRLRTRRIGSPLPSTTCETASRTENDGKEPLSTR